MDLLGKRIESAAVGILIVLVITCNGNTVPSCTTPPDVAEYENVTLLHETMYFMDCFDGDAGLDGTLQYTIISGNDDTLFDIDVDTGEIYLTDDWDFDDDFYFHEYELEIVAADQGTPNLDTTEFVKITLLPYNESPPFVFNNPLTIDVYENVLTGNSLGQLSIFESDWKELYVDQEVTTSYVVPADPDCDKFQIDPNTWTFSAKSSLDYESSTYCNITIHAVDVGQEPSLLTSTAYVLVTIKDVNDNAPVPGQSSYMKTILETATINDTIQDLNCTDAESPVTCTIASGNTTKFKVENCVVKLSSTIDVDTEPSTYTLTVHAVDEKVSPLVTEVQHTTIISVTIVVGGVDDNVPVWATPNNGIYTVSIDENSNIGTSVLTITALDADQTSSYDSTITYKIDTATDIFGIQSSTGEIFVKKHNLDREYQDLYTLSISAYSSDQSNANITGNVSISISDLNDNIPSFNETVYYVSKPENTGMNTVLVTVNATDPDLGSNGQITYSITSGNLAVGCTGLSIDNATGEITNSVNLDYETGNVCTLTVAATDGGGKSNSVNVIITVSSVNEFTPTFSANISKSLSENTLPGVIEKVTAVDNDAGRDGDVTYILDTHTSTFSIDKIAGNIYLTTTLDRESVSEYQLDIRAVDDATPAANQKTGYITVTYTIGDVNDNTPTCENPAVSKIISSPGSLTVGDVIHSLNCSDPDNGSNGDLLYNLTNCGEFSVAADGQFKISSLPLSKFIYLCTIQIVDQGVTALSTYVSISIVVHKVPSFTSATFDIDVKEDESLGTLLLTLNTSVISDSQKTVEIISGNGDNKFRIETPSGKFYTKGGLDRESTSSYDIGIKLTDDVSGLNATTNLNITITDVNDNKPIFTQTFSFSVDEKVAIDSTVGFVNATDADLGINSDITYTVVGGVSHFDVDSSTGEIKVNTSNLDASVQNNYVLVVKATDGGTPAQFSTTAVTITVNDLNDITPTFDNATYNIDISEFVSIGNVVQVLKAEDADLGTNGQITYKIRSGNGDSKFDLASSTGYLTINNTLDRETLDNYVLVIEAVDGGTPTANTGSTTVSVTVTDYNDNPPVPSPTTYSLVVPRIAATSSVLTTITATDADDGLNKEINFYMKSGNTDNLFLVNTTTGEITPVSPLTTAADTYTLLINVIDNGVPALSSTATMSITMDPPISPPTADHSFTLAENQALSPTVFGTVSKNAVHAGGAIVDFTITVGDTSIFAVGGTSGDLSLVANLDYETNDNHHLTIRLVDRATPAITYYKQVHVTVTDINDNSPVFGSASYAVDIVENTPVGTTIQPFVTASDLDSGLNGQITYSLSTINPAALDYLQIDPTTGFITVKKSPDFEVITSLVTQVVATDAGTPPNQVSVAYTATVINVLDDSTGAGTACFVSTEIPSNAVNDEVFLTFTPTQFGMTPGLGDTVTYRTLGQKGVFDVQLSTGDLYVLDKSFIFNDARYTLTVVAEVTSAGNNKTSNYCLVRVDTFKTTQIVTVTHGLSKSLMDPQINALRIALQTLYPPTTRVGIYKIIDTSSTSRRRLLATQSESLMYVVEDTSSDTVEKIDEFKGFQSQSAILGTVQQSSDGTPVTALTSGGFTAFAITSVMPYTDTSTRTKTWPETTTGIAVLSIIAGSLVLLAAILALYFCCTRHRKYRMEQEEKNSNVAAVSAFDRPEPVVYPSEDKSPLVAPYRTSPSLGSNNKAFVATYPVNTEAAPSMNGIENTKPKKKAKSSKTMNLNLDEVPGKLFQSNNTTKMYVNNPRDSPSIGSGTVTPRSVILETESPVPGTPDW